MENGEKKRLAEPLEKSGDPMIVRSAFDLSPEMRQRITRALHENIHREADVSYRTIPDLVLGVELKIDGRKLAWSVSDYLEDLEETAGEALEAEAREEDNPVERENETKK